MLQRQLSKHELASFFVNFWGFFPSSALVIVAGSSHFYFRFSVSLTFEVHRKTSGSSLVFFPGCRVLPCSSALPFPFPEVGDTFILSLLELGIFPKHF